jgi:hypothetical protein
MQRRELGQEQLQLGDAGLERLHSQKAEDTKYFADNPKLYWAILVAVLVAAAYLILVPREFRIPEEWEESAAAALTGACMALFFVRSWVRQTFSFWIALTVSSGAQVSMCHWLHQRYRPHSRGEGKLIWLASIGAGYVLGAVLFLVLQRFTSREELRPPDINV